MPRSSQPASFRTRGSPGSRRTGSGEPVGTDNPGRTKRQARGLPRRGLTWAAIGLFSVQAGCASSQQKPQSSAAAVQSQPSAPTAGTTSGGWQKSGGPARTGPPRGGPIPGEPLALIPVHADDAVWGSPLAPVTIVEFVDFQCPFCALAHKTIETLKSRFGPDNLRVATKHLPLEMHQDAVSAAVAAQSVKDLAGSEAFSQLAAIMFSHQSELSKDNLVSWAVSLGIDRKAFIAAYQSEAVLDSIRADMLLAARLQTYGTPAFWINGARVEGAQPIAVFDALIRNELEQAKLLTDGGLPRRDVYRTRVLANLGIIEQ